ncbi:zinc carboxypeptidase [Bacterioplanes sanyensis]|uniref:Zinc carboxypeptidase n=1 Tax=Bacterioplanes sanyensis TaxID=1249553 RepID=A0A222FLN5_9GAMM|nr:M14 family zinc carboxypeptidase [Bacterioplanes sanyensis]ASP39679.1 zinc carboxypeptidase [Bacterioplanes sanyensis]
MIQRIYHLKRALPELFELEKLIQRGRHQLRVSVPAHIRQRVDEHHIDLPFYVIEAGSLAPLAPTLILVGGVHGIERIGTQVILAFLRTLLERLDWDPAIHEQLAQLRLLVLPIVNPAGMWRNQRANANGVDLMRNAPIDADGDTPWLIGGQRISRHLPWYRGRKEQPMESESQTLVDVVGTAIRDQPHCISIDCHSGFGVRDRLWFPYAGSHHPWPSIAEALALTQLFERTYPSHTYLFEPQSLSYTTHGDLWDYLYQRYSNHKPDGIYLPLTLEMGSWLWVKKNPRHLFRYHSLFNPIMPHRQQRIQRRHLLLFDFLMSAVRSMPTWAPAQLEQKQSLHHLALERWYPHESWQVSNPG